MFLGKHSGNMFMIHGIIYAFFPSLVFFSHNVVLSVVTLLMVSLLVSIIIELLKKILHYDSVIARFSDDILLKIVGVGNSLPHV